MGLKLAAQGFQEESKNFMDMLTYKRTTKRVYSYVFPDSCKNMVKLK